MAAFERTRGDTWGFTLPLVLRGTTDPFPLTPPGTTIKMTFKTNKKLADNAAGVFQYSWISGGASDGITVADPAAGIAVVTIPKEDTANFLVTKYFYDVEITDQNGGRYTSEPDPNSPNPLNRVATVKVIEDVTSTP